MRIETKCVREGYKPKNGEPGALPIYQSTTYVFDSTQHIADLFDMPMEYMFPFCESDRGCCREEDRCPRRRCGCDVYQFRSGGFDAVCAEPLQCR